MTMTAQPFSDVAEAFGALDPDQPGRTLDLLARMLDLGDADLSARSGVSRAAINAKRRGTRQVQLRDLWPLAAALGVEPDWFVLPPAEAARRLIEAHPDRLTRPPTRIRTIMRQSRATM